MPPTTTKKRYAEQVMDKLHRLSSRSGPNGLRELTKRFKLKAGEGGMALCSNEVTKTLENLGIILKPEETRYLIEAFDENDNNKMDVASFLEAVTALPPQRREAVNAAYRTLDKEGKGYINTAYLTRRYNAKGHPKVTSGVWDEAVAKELFRNDFDQNGDDIVTHEEFLAYYTAASRGIDNEEYFLHLLYNTWMLDDLHCEDEGYSSSPPAAQAKQSFSQTRGGGYTLTSLEGPAHIPSHPPAAKRVVGYTGHVPGAQDCFGESFSKVEEKSVVPPKAAKLPKVPYKDEEHAFVRKGNAANMHSFRLE
eukprot:TRINITY_DN25300_c0_g1_i1.p1 TRINITY_DN25300_c0_g1~~TRINITY_DN25300_c0_g1_i1.p1  ORF type:complete len:328 (+),score=56.76 TRINITY_DN25300_c0_g1_i1:63-986(+)